MATKSKKQTYYVNARIVVDTNLEIQAESLEDALAQSRSLKLDDFMELTGDNNENNVRITGVHEEYETL